MPEASTDLRNANAGRRDQSASDQYTVVGHRRNIPNPMTLILSLIHISTVDWSDADWSRYPAFAFLQSVDASGNACPSLHVAFAMFTAVWLGRLLRQMGAGRGVRAFNWLWCLGIFYSTVAIRQHVALDVLAGAGLGAAVSVAHLRWLRVSG